MNKILNTASTKAKKYASKMTGNKRSTSRYQFPSDLDSEGSGNIIRFSFNLPSGSKYLKDGSYKKGIDPRTGKSTSTYRGDSNSRSLQRKFSQNYVRTSTYIDLFMPSQIQTSYSSDWSVSELGFVGALIDAGTSLGDMSWSNAERIWEIAKNQMTETAKSTLAGTVQALTPLKTKDALKMYTSTVANPYMEVIFNGVSNRTFSFTFKMIPKNQSEQYMIKKIVDEFVFHRAPEIKYEQQNNFMVFPSEVDIKFIHRTTENPWLFKISSCAITNVTVNHSPEGNYSSHPDGSPFATEMTVSFIELENLTKERHRDGY